VLFTIKVRVLRNFHKGLGIRRVMWERNAYKILIGKSEGKRQLGRHKRRWEGNIRMDLREIGSEGMDWIHLV